MLNHAPSVAMQMLFQELHGLIGAIEIRARAIRLTDNADQRRCG